MKKAYLEINACKHGHIYKLHSRNLVLGVFNSESASFVGIREKFGDRFLDSELHWDNGPPFGTAKPKAEIGKIPDGFEVSTHLGPTIDIATKRPVAFDRPVMQGGRGWYFVDTNEASQAIRPKTPANTPLFEFLQEAEKSV